MRGKRQPWKRIQALGRLVHGLLPSLGFGLTIYFLSAVGAWMLGQDSASIYLGLLACLVFSIHLAALVRFNKVFQPAKWVIWAVLILSPFFLVRVLLTVPKEKGLEAKQMRIVMDGLDDWSRYEKGHGLRPEAEKKQLEEQLLFHSRVIAESMFVGFVWIFSCLAFAYGISAGMRRDFDPDGLWIEIRSRGAFAGALLCLIAGMLVGGLKHTAGIAYTKSPEKFRNIAMFQLVTDLLQNAIFSGSGSISPEHSALKKFEDQAKKMEAKTRNALRITLWELLLLVNGGMYFITESIFLKWRTKKAAGGDNYDNHYLFRILWGFRTGLSKAALLLTLNRVLIVLLEWPLPLRFWI